MHLCCVLAIQGPLKWVEKSPPISKGFEAGPEHTGTIVNFTLGHKDDLQASSLVAGTVKGLTPGGNGSQGGGGGGQSQGVAAWRKMAVSQHGLHTAGTYLLLARLRQCRRTWRKNNLPFL